MRRGCPREPTGNAQTPEGPAAARSRERRFSSGSGTSSRFPGPRCPPRWRAASERRPDAACGALAGSLLGSSKCWRQSPACRPRPRAPRGPAAPRWPDSSSPDFSRPQDRRCEEEVDFQSSGSREGRRGASGWDRGRSPDPGPPNLRSAGTSPALLAAGRSGPSHRNARHHARYITSRDTANHDTAARYVTVRNARGVAPVSPRKDVGIRKRATRLRRGGARSPRRDTLAGGGEECPGRP